MSQAKELSPVHRIARAVSAILLLSILQVVGAPILAPQLTTPIASAADANDLPTGLGTVYQFLAESYTSGSTTWPEATGGAGATISASALKVTNTAGTLGANKSVVAVQGSFQTSITFPATVAYGNATNPNDYTFFHVARYAPQQTGLTNANYCDTSANHVTNNSAKKNRIFSSTANNWLSGFWACSAGVAYHMGWLTQSTSAVSELSGNSGNNWLLSADCGYVASSTSGCNGRYRAFGTDRTTTPSTSVVGHRVIVNGGQFPLEVSDFQIAEVISYPTILSIADIVKVETYLARKYGITLSSTAATKLGIHRASVGTTLNEPLRVQPQVAIQDSNGQTVTTDNSTLITATVTGVNGRIIGTATADAVQGIATFDNLGLDGVPGNSYTITYSSNAGLASTSESRVFSRGGGSETDTALSLNATAGLNQYAEVTDYTGSPVDITGNVTLEAWVYPTSSCATDQGVISKFNSYMLYCGGGVWKYVFDSDGSSWAGSSSSIAVRPNEWQHVAYVKSGTTLTIYIDGQVMQSITGQSATLVANNDLFSIGRYGGGNYFQGRIDEVRVYNAARSQVDVQSDMHAYGTITDSNLRAYFDFNEGSGSTLFNRDAGAVASDDLTIYNTTSQNWTPIPTTSTSQAYTVVSFPRSVLTSSGGWNVPSGIPKLSYLVVAGGGAGGASSSSGYQGGGGGGGGVRTGVLTSPSGVIAPVVGMGQIYNSCVQSRGGNSRFSGATFSAIEATGGGSGGCYNGSSLIAGNSGGSGGGGAAQTTRSAPGSGNAGNYSPVEGFVGGVARLDGTYEDRQGGGGGGGATSAGGAATYVSGTFGVTGDGGTGFVTDISGESLGYGGGGGGGARRNTSGGTATDGGGAGGKQSTQGSPGVYGRGGGGGGTSLTSGNNGGSGVIIIRWITATAPIFTGPSSDTLTAGLVETFTVTGTPNSPLTRNFLWQISTDTGTSWSNATTGTGFTAANYITPTLETATSGIRYQYRVVVTDSDTAGLFIVETSTAVYLTINPRITITGSSVSLTQKYSETQTVTYTIANGTGTRTTAISPNNRTGITWSSVSGSSATLSIASTLGFGTYYETITVTDSVTATTTQMVTISISKAETITVTATASTTTYNGSAITPVYVVSGLKNGETATATSNFVGINGTSYGGGSTSCASGGTCSVGDIAPGGGYVFYVSATTINVASGISDGGIYLATAPQTWNGGSIDPNASWGCGGTTISGTFSNAVGSGAENTRLINVGCATAGIASRITAASSAAGFTDWFLPSLDELTLIYNNLKVPGLSNLQSWNYWSSTQSTSNAAGSAKYWWFGSGATSGETDKNNSAGSNMYVRAIRAFSPTVSSTTTTPPTDAGSYRFTPSDIVLSVGASLNNYQGVTYESATVTINKAFQAKLSIGQYDAFPGISSYPINVYGGTGLGTVTRTLVDAGTANCAFSGTLILTASQVGTCTVRAVKDGGVNYFAETTTAIIYWMTFINRYTPSAPTTPTDLGLSGSTGFEKRSYETFTVLSFANGSGTAVTSAAKGSVMQIIGTGFDASDATTEVIIGFFSIPSSSLVFDTTNPLANFVQFTLPNSSDLDLGANDVAMKSRKGWAFASGLLTVTSPVSI